MCFIAGGCVLVGLKIQYVKSNPKSVGVIATFICLTLLGLQLTVQLDKVVIDSLGRDSSLTDRIPLWEDIISLGTNPVVGSGYNSFFLGDRVKTLWEKWPWRPNSTHNGYLDTYVNLGWVGLLLLLALLISTFMKLKRELIADYEFGRFGMGWLVVVLLYNYAESAFVGLHLIWFIFLLVAVDYRRWGEKDRSLLTNCAIEKYIRKEAKTG
jgi:O-antigen ligase